ncbi:hypothetical protein ACFL3C_02310 [Patescibacteria group bacterium]
MAIKEEPTGDQKFKAEEGVASVAHMYDKEAIEVIVEFLRREENNSIPLLLGSDGDIFADDIIRHLENRTPQGMQFLGIWRKMDGIPLKDTARDGKLRLELNELVGRLRELAKTIA